MTLRKLLAVGLSSSLAVTIACSSSTPGGSESNCSQLSSCCPKADTSACAKIAMTGNPSECAGGLATYCPTVVVPGQDSGSPTPDAAANDSGSGATVPCAEVTGTGVAKTCSYRSDSSTCPQGKQGHCPSSGLVGCCVATTQMGTSTAKSALCYYNSAAAKVYESSCTGSSQHWQSTAP
jgi:hypothetical protein